MRRLVLDASAALRVVLRQQDAEGLARRVGEARLVLAPDLFVCEVANGLWKYVSSGQLDVDEAQARLEEARQLVDVLVSGDELAREALATAARHRHPVYDLLYAVLARRHGCGVLTADRRMAALLADLDLPNPFEE
jgi:predicted nucleic acid-binding protein